MTLPRLIIFDKDGTLVDHATWDVVTGRLLESLAPAGSQRHAAAEALDYNLSTRRFNPSSDILALSNDVWIDRLAPNVPGGRAADFAIRVDRLMAELIATSVVAMDGASPLLERLARSAVLALATNDAEASARAQLRQLGWDQLFDYVVGYDSGFGAKPEPGMLGGLLDATTIAPSDALMVGDSWADAESAARAGVPFCLLDPDGTAKRRLDPATPVAMVARRLDDLSTALAGFDAPGHDTKQPQEEPRDPESSKTQPWARGQRQRR